MINLTSEELQRYKKLKTSDEHHNNNGTIYIDEDKKIIYKLIDTEYFFPDETSRNIDYQIDNPIPNTPVILDKLSIDGKYSGYVMTYIENSISFRDALSKQIPEEKRIKAIIDIYKTLRYLHSNNITLGDIHMDNFLINEDGGYIIDLDYMRFPGDEFKFQTCYDVIVNNKKHTRSNKYTDSLKVMVVSLSLLIGRDLEKLIKGSELRLEDILSTISNPSLQEFINKSISTEEPLYFDEYLKEQISKNIKI